MTRFLILLLLLLSHLLIAQEDEYHSALRQQLESQFGITGGEWVLGETEKQTNAKIQLTNVTRKTLTAEEDQPFSQVLVLVID